MTREEFVEVYGEDPIDVLGSDWEILYEVYSKV